MQKDIEKLEQNTSWKKKFEAEFGDVFLNVDGEPYIATGAVNAFIRETLANREKELAEEIKRRKR